LLDTKLGRDDGSALGTSERVIEGSSLSASLGDTLGHSIGASLGLSLDSKLGNENPRPI
jgi:hypothetical protein